MQHRQITDAVEQAGFMLDQLFYIAAQFESSELKEFLEHMFDFGMVDSCFNFNFENSFERGYNSEEMIDKLFEWSKTGWVARIDMPTRSNFRFDDDGNVIGCKITYAKRSMYYAYGETFEELFQKLIECAEVHKKLEVEVAKNKQ